MTTTRPQQPTEVLAVALPVLAVGNSVAVVSVLQSRWFWGFFDPWRVPVAFLCFSIALGVVCWLISRQVEGLYEYAATAGAVFVRCYIHSDSALVARSGVDLARGFRR